MSLIPKDLIFPYIGLNSAIPSQWTRETSLDGKYVKGHNGADNLNSTGGNATHTHTSPAHSHTMVDHQHTYNLDVSPDRQGRGSGNDQASGGLRDAHTHTGTSGSVVGGDLSSVAATYDTCSNDPPYYEVIFIKSLGSAPIPNNLLAFWEKTTIPNNWYFCDGNNSTPDLRNKYLKGAGAGGNSGGTGGSTQNVHTLTHSHTSQTHTHAAASSSNRVGGTNARGDGGTIDSINYNHTHSISLDGVVANISAANPTLTTTETVEPSYLKVSMIQKKTNGRKEKGIVGIWLRPLNEKPNGWIEKTAWRDKHLKIVNDNTQIGATGGSNMHTHAAQSHTHSASGSHTHPSAQGLSHVNGIGSNGNGISIDIAPSAHTISSISSVTATYNSASTTADSSSNEPPYRTVAFLEFKYDAGGSVLLNLLN